MNMDSIADIISNLSDSDIAALQETAASFLGGSNENKNENQSQNSCFDFSAIDPAMIGKITRIMSALNSSSSDPRCDLIKALKPLLSNDKKKRADDALQIMKMLQIIPLIKNMG